MLRALFRWIASRAAMSAARPATQCTEPEGGWEAYFARRAPPGRIDDVPAWDEFWRINLEGERHPSRLRHYWEVLRPLLPWMRSSGASTVLSAACGISLEVRAFAAAGFHAVGMDRSAVAIEYARGCVLTDGQRNHFLDVADARPGGSARFEVGDLLDATVAPGPFDVVVCRSTAQYFAQAGRLDEAMSALAARVRPGGVLVITSHFSVIDVAAAKAIDSWLETGGYRLVHGVEPRPEDFSPRSAGERRAWHAVSTG